MTIISSVFFFFLCFSCAELNSVKGISAAINTTAPAVMTLLGIRDFPFAGGSVNNVDLETLAGMPKKFPKKKRSCFSHLRSTIGPFFYLLLLNMILPAFIGMIVYEKENRLQELMKMNGEPPSKNDHFFLLTLAH